MEQWLVLALLSPLLYAFSNILDKFLMEKKVTNCFALAPISGICIFTFATIIFFLTPFENLTSTQFLIAFLLGAAQSITYMIYYNALSFEEVSRVVSIWYINQILVLILSSIFLHERLLIWKYPAIILAAAGAVLMGLKTFENKIVIRKAFYWLLLNCIIAAIATTIQKYLLS